MYRFSVRIILNMEIFIRAILAVKAVAHISLFILTDFHWRPLESLAGVTGIVGVIMIQQCQVFHSHTLRSFDHKHRFRQRSGLHTANRVIAFIAAHVNGHIAGPKPDALIIEFRYCGQRIFQFAVHNGGNIHQKRVQRTGTVRHIDLRSDHQVQRRLQLRKGQVTIPVCDFRSGQQLWLFLSKRRQLLSCLTAGIVVEVRPIVLEGRKLLCCLVSQCCRIFLHCNICDFHNGICVVRKRNGTIVHIHMAIQLKASHQLLRIHRSLEGCQQHYYQKKNDPTAIF